LDHGIVDGDAWQASNGVDGTIIDVLIEIEDEVIN